MIVASNNKGTHTNAVTLYSFKLLCIYFNPSQNTFVAPCDKNKMIPVEPKA